MRVERARVPSPLARSDAYLAHYVRIEYGFLLIIFGIHSLILVLIRAQHHFLQTKSNVTLVFTQTKPLSRWNSFLKSWPFLSGVAHNFENIFAVEKSSPLS